MVYEVETMWKGNGCYLWAVAGWFSSEEAKHFAAADLRLRVHDNTFQLESRAFEEGAFKRVPARLRLYLGNPAYENGAKKFDEHNALPAQHLSRMAKVLSGSAFELISITPRQVEDLPLGADIFQLAPAI